MTTNPDRVSFIRERLQNFFSPTHLEVIDESEQHVGHAGYQGGNHHFAIIIAAPYFQGLSRVAAHQSIYSLLSDLIPGPIHALRIKIIA